MKATHPVPINVEPGQFSYSLMARNLDGDPVIIPVMDVRDGAATREVVRYMERTHNRQKGSLYLRVNQYNGGSR